MMIDDTTTMTSCVSVHCALSTRPTPQRPKQTFNPVILVLDEDRSGLFRTGGAAAGGRHVGDVARREERSMHRMRSMFCGDARAGITCAFLNPV